MAKKKEDEKMEVKAPTKQVIIGIKGDPASAAPVVSRGMTKFISGVAKAPEQEELVSPAMVINRLDHPMTLSYDGEGMVVPPKGRVKIANMQKLGGVPAGIQVLLLKK